MSSENVCIIVSGAGSAEVNGQYDPVDELYDGKQAWAKNGTDFRIENYAGTQWWIWRRKPPETQDMWFYYVNSTNDIVSTTGWIKDTNGSLPVPTIQIERFAIHPKPPVFDHMEVSRNITLKINDQNTEQNYPIQTNEHVAIHCGEVIKNLIEGDGTATEYPLKLPDIKCLDILWRFFRIGQIERFHPTDTQFVSLCQCADYLSSDYLIELCRNWFTRNLDTALQLSQLEAFNSDTIPAPFFEKLLGNMLQRNGGHNVVKNWLQGSGRNTSIYTICEVLCNKIG